MTDALPTSRRITLTDAAELVGAIGAGSESGRRFGLLIFCESEAQLKLLDEGASIVVGRAEPAEVAVHEGSRRFWREVVDVGPTNVTIHRGAAALPEAAAEPEGTDQADELGVHVHLGSLPAAG